MSKVDNTKAAIIMYITVLTNFLGNIGEPPLSSFVHIYHTESVQAFSI